MLICYYVFKKYSVFKITLSLKSLCLYPEFITAYV